MIEEWLPLVGRLTVDQAAALTGRSRRAATAQLERAVSAGRAVKFAGAYWDPPCPRRQARHRALIADAYIAMQRWPEEVSVHADHHTPNTAARPDLLVRVHQGDYSYLLALEADTGSESRRQWQAKAANYRLHEHPVDLMLAVAPTAPRAARLQQWWNDAGNRPPGLAVSLGNFPDHAPKVPAAEPPAVDQPASGDQRRCFYVYEGRLYPPSEGAAMAARLHLLSLGTERRAGFDLHYLARRRGGTPATDRASPF